MTSMWTDIGLFSASLLWVVVLVKLAHRWLPHSALWAVVVLALIVAMVPINGLVIGSYLFPLGGCLSISSLLLLLASLVFSCVGSRMEVLRGYWQSPDQRFPVVIFFVLSGLLLYPKTAGLTMFDPSRLGFSGAPGSLVLPLYLMSWAIVSVLRGWYLLLLLTVCATLGFYLKVLPSMNLWDYILDPLVVIYSFFSLLNKLRGQFT